MILNKKVLYAAGLLSVASSPFISDVYADMNMRKALEVTANTNPQIRADEASAYARERVIRQAEAGYLPKVDLSFSAGPERVREKINPSPASSGLDFGSTLYRRNPAVNASQMVFDGWKTRSDVDRATTDYIQGTKKADETNELLAYRAAAAYIKVRRFQRLRREAERNLAAHKGIAGTVEELIKGGRASTADRATVAARIATATNAVTDIQGDLDDATAEFHAIVGIEPDRLVSAKIPEHYMPACVNDAIMVARERNKSVILTRASLDVALAELNVVEAAFYPKVTVEATANRAKNNVGEKGRIDIFNVLGVVRYNLYNGGADSAKVSEIVEKISQQRFLVDKELRTAEEEVRRSWAQKISSTENAIQQRKAVVALREEMGDFQKQYELGTRTLVDVLGSINEYFLARGALITSDAAQDTSEARLLASMGMLTESFGTTMKETELYSEKCVVKQPSDYSHDHCRVKGGLPQATISNLPTKEPALKTVAHKIPAQQDESSFFGDFLSNLASTEPVTNNNSGSNQKETQRPTQVLAEQKPSKQDEENFFSNFLMNLASTEPATPESAAAPAEPTVIKPSAARPARAPANAGAKAKKGPAHHSNAHPGKAAVRTAAAWKNPAAQAPAPVSQAPAAQAENNGDSSSSWFSSFFSSEDSAPAATQENTAPQQRVTMIGAHGG